MWTDKLLIDYRKQQGWPPLVDDERAQVLAVLKEMTQAENEYPSFSWVEPVRYI